MDDWIGILLRVWISITLNLEITKHVIQLKEILFFMNITGAFIVFPIIISQQINNTKRTTKE